jgi:hypothetical protein
MDPRIRIRNHTKITWIRNTDPKALFPPGPIDGAPGAAAGRVGPVGGRTPRIGRNLTRPARPARLPMAAGRLAQGGGQPRLLEPLAALALLLLALHARLLGLDLGEALGGGGGGGHYRLRPVGLLGRPPRPLLLLASAVLLARLRLRVLPGLSFNALLRKKRKWNEIIANSFADPVPQLTNGSGSVIFKTFCFLLFEDTVHLHHFSDMISDPVDNKK